MLEQTMDTLSKKFGVQLFVTFDSRQETGCTDEEFGEFLQCEFNLGFESPFLQDYPPIIMIYEEGLVQFFHDATPYPVSANTKQQCREMAMDACPCPVHHELVTVDDFNAFVSELTERAKEYDE